jgi:hypothetical protein
LIPNVSTHALEHAHSHAFNPTLATPLPADDNNDFPPAHKILKMVAHLSAKVAGAHCSIPELKGKGKRSLIDPPAVSQSGKGKHKAASPLQPANGKKQCGGRAVGVANYSVEDLDVLLIFSRSACHWVAMHGTLQLMNLMHGHRKMVAYLKL